MNEDLLHTLDRIDQELSSAQKLIKAIRVEVEAIGARRNLEDVAGIEADVSADI